MLILLLEYAGYLGRCGTGEGVDGVSKEPKAAKNSSSNDPSQVLMLSLQMQALALAVEEIRGRVVRIERHLKLHKDDEARAALRELGEIGDGFCWTRPPS